MFAILIICALAVEEVNRAPAVGMVLAVKATILDRHGKKARGLEVGDVLHPGEKLSVDSQGEAILYFFSKEGHRERLKRGAQVVVGELGCSPPDAIERLKAPPLSQTNTKNLHEFIQGQESAVGILRGAPTADPPVVTPIYGASVLTDRPTFGWLAMDGADEYEFVLLSAANGDGEEVLWKATTREPRLEYPVKESPLLLGRTYHWRVMPLSKGNKDRNTITGKISTLTRSELEELSQLDGLIAGSDPQVLLLAAVIFDAHDVSDKALILYERLAKLAPEQVNLQVALAGYYRLAGRLPEARVAEDRAKKLRQTGP